MRYHYHTLILLLRSGCVVRFNGRTQTTCEAVSSRVYVRPVRHNIDKRGHRLATRCNTSQEVMIK